MVNISWGASENSNINWYTFKWLVYSRVVILHSAHCNKVYVSRFSAANFEYNIIAIVRTLLMFLHHMALWYIAYKQRSDPVARPVPDHHDGDVSMNDCVVWYLQISGGMWDRFCMSPSVFNNARSKAHSLWHVIRDGGWTHYIKLPQNNYWLLNARFNLCIRYFQKCSIPCLIGNINQILYNMSDEEIFYIQIVEGPF